jgi:hypothetical protein
MSKATHYTPPLSRFIVCAPYHEAKTRGIPMPQLHLAWLRTGCNGRSAASTGTVDGELGWAVTARPGSLFNLQ